MSSATQAARYLREIQEQVDSQRTDDLAWPRSRASLIGLIKAPDDPIDPLPSFIPDGAETSDAVRKMRARLRRQLDEVELPSKFEDPWTYLQLQEHDVLLRAAIGEHCPRVALGTLPLGRVNAASIPVPGSDEFIVIVAQGLLSFVQRAATTVIQGLPVQVGSEGLHFLTDHDAIRRHVDSDPDSHKFFAEFVSACLFAGDPAAMKPLALRDELSFISFVLERATLRFILAHEYSHILAGHCGEIGGVKVDPTGVLLDRVDYSWEQELEADERGVVLALNAGARKQEPGALTFAGIDLFFSIHSILERASAVVRFGAAETMATATHPPADIRRGRIRDVLRARLLFQRIGQQGHLVWDDPIGERLLEMALATEVMLERWFELIGPELKKAHRSKRTLAPYWYEVAAIEKTWLKEPPSLYEASQKFIKKLSEGISLATRKEDIDRAIEEFKNQQNFRYTGNPRRERSIAEADREAFERDREHAQKIVEEIFGKRN